MLSNRFWVGAVLLCVSMTAHSQQYSSWMSDNWNLVKDQSLADLVIPGSHDAGTYDLFANAFVPIDHKALKPGAPQEYCTILGYDFGFCTGYAITQSGTIYDQLKAGSRFFDLRFARTKESGGLFNFRVHHSFVGSTSDEVFSDIRRYLAEPGHDKEIIILQFTQMVGYENGVAGKNSFTVDEHREFLAEFGVQFADAAGTMRSLASYMIESGLLVPDPYDRNAPDFQVPCDPGISTCLTVTNESMTPQQIVDAGKQLIVYYPGEPAGEGHAQQDVYGEQSNKLWTAPGAGSWVGGLNIIGCRANGGIYRHIAGLYSWTPMSDSECGDLYYPEPSFWQSEDSIANDWIVRLGGRSATNPRSSVTNISFGADKILQIFLNTLVPAPQIIGWGDLEDAAAFTNPRAIPHLIARPRRDTNIIMLDFFESSGIMEEVLLLNKNPARVTVRINSIEAGNTSECGPNHIFEEDCDFYPVFFTNNNESEAPVEALSLAHQRGRVIDDKNKVVRGTDYDGFQWTYTTAVAWDDPLLAYIQIWDDDTEDGLGLNEDDLVETAFLFGPLDILQQLKTATPDGPIWFRQKFEAGFGLAKVLAEICIQSWDTDADTDACNPPQRVVDMDIRRVGGDLSANEGDALNFETDILDASATVLLAWDFGDGSAPLDTPATTVGHVYLDDGTFGVEVSGEISSTNGQITGRGLLAISVLGVAPTASFGNETGDIPQNTLATLVFSDQFDPSQTDTDAGFTYIYDCGNGTASEEAGIAVSRFDCLYPEPGNFIASGKIRDKDGESTQYEVLIKVADAIAPVVTPPADVVVKAHTYLSSQIGYATATDNVDTDLDIARDPAFTFFPVGETIITWSATDSAGNVGTATQKVTAVKSGGGAFGFVEFLLLLTFVATRRKSRAKI